jgi:hypothetical protein
MKKIVFSILLCVAAIFVAGLAMTAVSSAAEGEKTERTDFQRLEGRWFRPDGGYILELRNITKKGSLKAAYFNPKPINVAAARLENNKGRISVFVELRDVNYPGSLYNLQYDSKTDSLRGTYFQAMERQTFAVEFVRSK